MVEAVAMRTFGLGGDSEVSLDDNAMAPSIKLGPRRLVPLSLLAANHGSVVIDHLARQVKAANAGRLDGRFALLTGVPAQMASGLSKSEAELYGRITAEPQPLDRLLNSVSQAATVNRLVARGLVHLSGLRRQMPATFLACRIIGMQKPHAMVPYSMHGARMVPGVRCAIRRRKFPTVPMTRLIRRSSEVVLETVFAEDGLGGAGDGG